MLNHIVKNIPHLMSHEQFIQLLSLDDVVDAIEEPYIYIYQFDKDNAVKLLYPSDPADLPLSKTTALPGKGVWFNLFSPEGKVMLAVLSTRWRCRDLEEPLSPEALIQRLAARDAPAIPALLHRVQFNRKR